MLQTVTIQNFKSLRDVTVNLQKVNLLIGPNNSGKSNFLKALAFLKEHYNQRIFPNTVDFSRLFYKHKYNSYVTGPNNSIAFCFQWKSQSHDQVNSFYQLELLGFNGSNLLTYIEGVGFRKGPINNKVKLTDIELIKKNFGSANILFENNLCCPTKKFRGGRSRPFF
jgi:energy-coupling factor transporter ATP-binding protein EcfA2